MPPYAPKEFVSMNYQRFKDIFMSKKDKIPKPVKGLAGVYSLKRLSEIVWNGVFFKVWVFSFKVNGLVNPKLN